MTKTSLGRLEKVDLKEIWPKEDKDFTPWLAEDDNIELLAETLDMDLEVDTTEKKVGRFRADILCKNRRDDSDNSYVVIENQIVGTDHKHLGQSITYAAGLEAKTIVWLAERFTDEHRAAIDWLNTITDDGFGFFALEIEVWRIGDSSPAPKFNIVSKPNEWSKAVNAAARGLKTEANLMRLAFWEALHEELRQDPDQHPDINFGQPLPRSYSGYPIGRGISVGALMKSRKKHIGVELYLSGKNATTYFRQLKSAQEEIEAALGFNLEWQELPDKGVSRIGYFEENCPLDAEERWPEYREWLTEHLEHFNRVFRPRIAQLKPENSAN